MSKQVTNQIMLITYADCMGNNLKDLDYVLTHYLQGAVSGLHILPFFPSSGDRGFAPLTYKEVDPAFGGWEEVLSLADRYYMMYDYMINHLSAESDIYKDFHPLQGFLARKRAHRRTDLQDVPAPGPALYRGPVCRRQHRKAVVHLQPHPDRHQLPGLGKGQGVYGGQPAVFEQPRRLPDPAGRSGLRHQAPQHQLLFVEPEIWQLINQCQQALEGTGSEILPEIHENYFIQKKLEEKDVYTYDFQLPMLILNAVYFGRTLYLKDWMKLCPRKQFTTLDTHDGIGVVDVRYLMPDEEVLETKRKVFEANPGIRQLYKDSNTKVNFSKFDTYQICCTYYDALGGDDERYLIARAVQFFAPGIPQVYYVGLFAGRNDFDFYNQTKQSRDINRHYYTLEEIEQEFKRPVVQRMNRLMKLRNSHPAFNGQFSLLDTDEYTLGLRWQQGEEYAQLTVDFRTFAWDIVYTEAGQEKHF